MSGLRWSGLNISGRCWLKSWLDHLRKFLWGIKMIKNERIITRVAWVRLHSDPALLGNRRILYALLFLLFILLLDVVVLVHVLFILYIAMLRALSALLVVMIDGTRR